MTYHLAGPWGDFFEEVRQYCLHEAQSTNNRMIWYAMLAMLRCISSMQKGTHFGCLFAWSITGLLSPSALLRAMDKLPGLPGALRARAVVEHTRKPGGLPRPERRGHLRAGTPALSGTSGAVRSG